MKLQSKSGFSLVELMVVVAIIGILATIAVPNFQRFQARAKQASAKTELTGVYTAQKAFYVEYNSYTPDMQLAGFVPEGIQLDGVANVTAAEVADINRIYGSSMGAVAATGAATTPVASAQFPGFGAGTDTNLVYADMGLVASSDYQGSGAFPAHAKGCEQATAANLLAARNGVTPGASREGFVAVARGCPRGTANYNAPALLDDWAMTHLRQIVNVKNGI
jgi:prepilin-type N-terminal cleavage/methylation domain-containing protein